MNPTSCAWRNLTLGAGTRYRILTVEGWEELPGGRYEKTPRTRGHGAHPSQVWADERIVTATGFCWSDAERDQLLAELRTGLVFGDGYEEPLAITAAGRTLTAGAQIIAARAVMLRGEWGVGRFGWLAQWRCPDPLRYGTPQTVATPLPETGGGLQYNLYKTGFLDYGLPGTLGRITLVNAGSAPAPILFGVTGGLEQGFEISTGGDRLHYPVPVPAGQVIELDTAAGAVLVEGTASRRGNLTIADWMQVPARDRVTGAPGELVVQFTSLGGARDPNAELAATVAETNW